MEVHFDSGSITGHSSVAVNFEKGELPFGKRAFSAPPRCGDLLHFRARIANA
jgi:hypothetical protein